jgi:hypothetical protein
MMCPVARPVASSTSARKSASTAASREIATPKLLSLPDSVSRVSRGRLEEIGRLLTARDLEVLRLVAQTRVCTGAQLERLFWHDGDSGSQARNARRSLSMLAEWRILDRLPREVGGRRAGSRGFIYTLGPSGVRLLAREHGTRTRRLNAPGERYVRHALTCTEALVRLREAHRGGSLELLEVQGEPACWRRFTGPVGQLQIVKPDLFVRVGAGDEEDRWAIETDMASEAAGTLLWKAHRYIEHYRSGSEQRASNTYPRVLWAAPNDRRAREIETIMRRLPGELGGLFTVCVQEDLVALIARQARS